MQTHSLLKRASITALVLSSFMLPVLAAAQTVLFGNVTGTAQSQTAGSLLFSHTLSTATISGTSCGLNSVSGKVYSDTLGLIDLSPLFVQYTSGQSTATVNGSVTTLAGDRIYFNSIGGISNGGNVTITNITSGAGSAIPFSGQAFSPTLGAISFSGVNTLWRPNCVNPIPAVDLKANDSDGPVTVNQGSAVNLTWASSDTGASTCTAGGAWSGTKSLQDLEGENSQYLTSNSTFTLTCGSASDSVTVNVGATTNNARFNIGDRVSVTVNGLNVRSTPNGPKTGSVSTNTLGIIQGGPVDYMGYIWWQVAYDTNITGWTAEGFEGVQFLVKVTGATPTPPPVGSEFNIGDRVRTTVNGLNVRSTPNGVKIGSVALGALGTITGGPIDYAGYIWWQIAYDTGIVGYSAEGSASVTYLVKVTGTAPTPTPPLATSSPIPAPTPTQITSTPAPESCGIRLCVGDRVQVAVSSLSIRSNSSGGARIAIARRGILGTIQSGPISSGGYTRWQVAYDTGITGWSAEGVANTIYLVKVSGTSASPSPLPTSPLPTSPIPPRPTPIGSGTCESNGVTAIPDIDAAFCLIRPNGAVNNQYWNDSNKAFYCKKYNIPPCMPGYPLENCVSEELSRNYVDGKYKGCHGLGMDLITTTVPNIMSQARRVNFDPTNPRWQTTILSCDLKIGNRADPANGDLPFVNGPTINPNPNFSEFRSLFNVTDIATVGRTCNGPNWNAFSAQYSKQLKDVTCASSISRTWGFEADAKAKYCQSTDVAPCAFYGGASVCNDMPSLPICKKFGNTIIGYPEQNCQFYTDSSAYRVEQSYIENQLDKTKKLICQDDKASDVAIYKNMVTYLTERMRRVPFNRATPQWQTTGELCYPQPGYNSSLGVPTLPARGGSPSPTPTPLVIIPTPQITPTPSLSITPTLKIGKSIGATVPTTWSLSPNNEVFFARGQGETIWLQITGGVPNSAVTINCNNGGTQGVGQSWLCANGTTNSAGLSVIGPFPDVNGVPSAWPTRSNYENWAKIGNSLWSNDVKYEVKP